MLRPMSAADGGHRDAASRRHGPADLCLPTPPEKAASRHPTELLPAALSSQTLSSAPDRSSQARPALGGGSPQLAADQTVAERPPAPRRVPVTAPSSSEHPTPSCADSLPPPRPLHLRPPRTWPRSHCVSPALPVRAEADGGGGRWLRPAGGPLPGRVVESRAHRLAGGAFVGVNSQGDGGGGGGGAGYYLTRSTGGRFSVPGDRHI